MAALTGDAPLPPAATRLLSLAWLALERASGGSSDVAGSRRLPQLPPLGSALRSAVQRGLERATLLTPRGAALAAERLAARPDGADPSAFGALSGSLAPTPRGEANEDEKVSYSPSHDSRPSPSRRRMLEEEAAKAKAPVPAAADPSSSPAPRRPSSAARFKALFTPPKGAKAVAATAEASAAAVAPTAAPAAVAAPPSSPVTKRPSSAQRLKAAFSPKQKSSKAAIEVSATAATVVVPPLLSSHALAASPSAAVEKPKRPSSAQRLKAAFSPKKAAGAGAESGSPAKPQRPSSAARLRAAFKIGGGTPDGKGSDRVTNAAPPSVVSVVASPARPAYVPGSIAAALAGGSPSQHKRFEF